MDIYDPEVIKKAIGAKLMVRGVVVKVLERAMCEYAPNVMSTYYKIETPEGESLLSAQTVHALLSGELTLDPKAPKEPSKRDRAGLLVKELIADGLESSAIIKRLMSDLELAKGTATSYYYALKNQ